MNQIFHCLYLDPISALPCIDMLLEMGRLTLRLRSLLLSWSRLVRKTVSRLVSNLRDHVIDDVWGFIRHNETPEARWLIRIFGAASFIISLVFPPCFIVTLHVWTMILRMKTQLLLLSIAFVLKLGSTRCESYESGCYNCSWPLAVTRRVSVWGFEAFLVQSGKASQGFIYPSLHVTEKGNPDQETANNMRRTRQKKQHAFTKTTTN